jgi:hypothetical protein
MADQEQWGGMSAAQPEGAEAQARLAEGVRSTFGSRLRSAWLSGSFVYGGAQPGASDIDIVIVLEEGEPVPADGEALARIRSFVDIYLNVHAGCGLDPDLDFPGEYVVPAALDEAIEWRGVAVEGRVARELPPPDSPDYWIGRPDRWSNAWLSMTAFTRYLAGDRSYHEAQKRAAWRSMARFILLRSAAPIRRDDIWAELTQFGVKPRYHLLRAVEEPYLARALDTLEAEGALTREGDRLVPQMESLRGWERRLAATIAAREGDLGPLVLPPDLHRQLGDYAKERWLEAAPRRRPHPRT